MSDTLTYFAYGSNMCRSEMQERCPDAQPISCAILRGHILCFPRYSKKQKCGVASIKTCIEQDVWGVLWRVTEECRQALDYCEGYREDRPRQCNSYLRDACYVETPNGQTVKAFTYVAVPQPGAHQPSVKYMDLMLCGAREFNLCRSYVDKLEQIKAQCLAAQT